MNNNGEIDKRWAARELLLKHSYGVLSTISVDVSGYPFGSVTPYCADEQCRPVIYISRIAQHTKNIIADSRVSLTVVEDIGESADVQAQGLIKAMQIHRLAIRETVQLQRDLHRHGVERGGEINAGACHRKRMIAV